MTPGLCPTPCRWQGESLPTPLTHNRSPHTWKLLSLKFLPAPAHPTPISTSIITFSLLSRSLFSRSISLRLPLLQEKQPPARPAGRIKSRGRTLIRGGLRKPGLREMQETAESRGRRERGAGGAAVTVCPQVLAVSRKRLGAALPSALQREKKPLWSMECWAAFATETEKIRHSRPRPSSPGNPLPPRCCWGLDTFSKRSAAAQTLATLISPKPFPSAGLTPHMEHPWVVSPEPSREGDVTKQVNPTRARWNSESQPQTDPLPRQEGLRTRMELLSSNSALDFQCSIRKYLLYTHDLLDLLRSVLECILCLQIPEDKVMQRLNKMTSSTQRQKVTLSLHNYFYAYRGTMVL